MLSTTTAADSNSRRKFGAFLALAGASSLASAQVPGGPHSGREGMAHGMGHGKGGMRDMMANPQMQERMLERRTSHMLDAVEATPEQRSRVMGIAKAAFKDIAPLRDQARASRGKGRELMFATNIDRGALEKMRQDQMKLRDSIGQRTLNGMLDAMAVLTPEQRAKLAARKPGGMGGGMGGMR